MKIRYINHLGTHSRSDDHVADTKFDNDLTVTAH